MKQSEELLFSREEGDLVERLKQYEAVFVISDRKVKDIITEGLVEKCIDAGVALRGVRYIKVSEGRKRLRTVEKIHRWLLDVGADRNALVLNVGGGIVSDLGGFSAATYMRGVAYANVPTTLLAQVDASIGGKTGVNVGDYKNIAGVFCQPEFTFINTDYLKTLDWDVLTSGYAELLKTFIIADATAYEAAVADESFDALDTLVQEAAAIKLEIVRKDRLDKGVRRVLNLGHSFAHAIEKKSADCLLRRALPCEKSFCGITARRMSHGHAVALGIIMAAELSESRNVAKSQISEKLKEDFAKLGLPVKSPWTHKQLAPIIASDKKSRNGEVNYVLIKSLGDVAITKIKP